MWLCAFCQEVSGKSAVQSSRHLVFARPALYNGENPTYGSRKNSGNLGGGETVKGTLINTPTLETGRLILRKFTERDLEWLFLILHDKEVNQFLPWYPIDSIEEAKKFYEER